MPVTIYEHAGFSGRSQVLTKGQYDTALGQISIGNDTLSSIKVSPGLGARLYEHSAFRGQFYDARGEISALVMAWNDRTSSIIVCDVTGGFAHSLALKSDGTVWAWGNNISGEFGSGWICPNQNGPNPNTGCYSTVPVQVSGLSGVTGIAAGSCGLSGFNLALKSDGTVWAWSSNLGNGTYCCSATPVQVAGLANVTGITGGASMSLAVKSNGTAWTWGGNLYGSLGNGTNANSYLPVQVVDHTNASGFLQNVSPKISARGGHGLVVMSDSTLRAWGSNQYGELGNGTKTNSNLPVKVVGPGSASVFYGATAVAQGDTSSLALSARSTVHAWGDNRYGQAGNPAFTCDPDTETNCLITSPVQVSTLAGVVAIGAGALHNLAIVAP